MNQLILSVPNSGDKSNVFYERNFKKIQGGIVLMLGFLQHLLMRIGSARREMTNILCNSEGFFS